MKEGCLLWRYRVVIPGKLRHKLLLELHRHHPGVVRMKANAQSYMWWLGLDREIEQVAKGCQPSQAVKRAPLKSLLHPWVWPDKPWQRVHLDFAGSVHNNRCSCMVAVDAYSNWPELRAMTISVTLNVLLEKFCTHGIPEQLVTDNGLMADAFTHFTEMNGSQHTHSVPYHVRLFITSFILSLVPE